MVPLDLELSNPGIANRIAQGNLTKADAIALEGYVKVFESDRAVKYAKT